MTARPKKVAAQPLSLRDAFEREFARREMERRAREDAERRRQAEDLAGAEALHEALVADPDFLEAHELVADRRRYNVSLDHARFRISAYFEAGQIAVALADKRPPPHSAAAPRRQDTAESVADALRLIAQFLVDETR